ncbi:bifunctional adenosylcobinamide kinase/adenosylcobinamide-phosphate guanylyltransferase [Rhodoferax sediminis]|uniref:Bifunctional adenosylcobalamin biosynthesis protein n=1 Tax=Rhodoferax sediminis TaxID=2509614 RepID=A0A515D7R4_9BURK|nr:bifunctional adenosylcobinamide kinase/adenosylcobinamide-phosphate guanylyltransferase [Rhodoferax sediminis]QDL36397.1 bifunctional adenosylcobinamide kinase/adenosylcobinamide-phosphate guanylyltransferase [Rhodoferax sediminis]
MTAQGVARSELILGGQKSGKSRRAEALAAAWLAQSPGHRAVFIATARAGDDEMARRIARHRQDRAARVPGMTTVEEPLQLAQAMAAHGRPDTLLVIDCLTLWLTNALMPAADPDPPQDQGDGNDREFKRNVPVALDGFAQIAIVLGAIRNAPGPVVLVSNEIGLGVIPLGREVRAFVDALGRLNQDLAQACERVTLMLAGLPVPIKDGSGEAS